MKFGGLTTDGAGDLKSIHWDLQRKLRLSIVVDRLGHIRSEAELEFRFRNKFYGGCFLHSSSAFKSLFPISLAGSLYTIELIERHLYT